MALLKIFQDNFPCQGLDTSFKCFTTITFSYIRMQIALTSSTSTPRFETKGSESYTKCLLFPQCNRLRHTNIQGNCKWFYVRSTYQSAPSTLLLRHFVSSFQGVQFLFFEPIPIFSYFKTKTCYFSYFFS